jgi:DNA-binding response OmpR family regulator
MPVMDGLGFLRELRARKDRNDFEVVIDGRGGAGMFIGAPGVLKVLKKPFDIEMFVELREFAARRTSGGASATTAASLVAGMSPPPAPSEE